MIGMFRQGWGHVRITDELLAAGMTMTAGRPNSTQIYRIIRNPALKGVKALAIDGENYELPGYYPAILNEIEFAELQVMMEGRARTGGASIRKIPGNEQAKTAGLPMATAGSLALATPPRSPVRIRTTAALFRSSAPSWRTAPTR
jgi:hypothetical protein